MTLKQLKAFLAVAQTLSFAEASERVFLSQPALSLAVKKLETSLGGRLIVRTTRTVSLTPEGKAMYEKARRMVNEWDALEAEMRQRFRLEQGMVSIAAMPSFAANQLPDVIAIFRKRHPAINVQIHDVIAEETVELVRSGQVELGVSFKPPVLTNSDVFTQLAIDRFVAVLPPDHPLSDSKEVSLKALLQSDFIALQRPSMVRVLLDTALAKEGIELDVSFESHQLVTVGRMVSKGLGVSVVPSICSEQMIQLGAKVVAVNSPIIACELGVLTKSKHELSMPAQALFDVLVGRYESISAE